MLHTWHALPEQADEDALVARWEIIRDTRARAMKVLEDLRSEGRLGSSLQAELVLKLAGERHAALASLGDDLRFVMITSSARLETAASADEESITATPSEHTKCGRCWHYRADVGHNAEHPELCGRCCSNLHGTGETRSHA